MWKGLAHRKAAPNSVRMWAVVTPSGNIVIDTLRTSPGAAILRFKTRHKVVLWEEAKHHGYTVRRVTVTLDPTETESINNNAPSASGVEDKPASA